MTPITYNEAILWIDSVYDDEYLGMIPTELADVERRFNTQESRKMLVKALRAMAFEVESLDAGDDFSGASQR